MKIKTSYIWVAVIVIAAVGGGLLIHAAQGGFAKDPEEEDPKDILARDDGSLRPAPDPVEPEPEEDPEIVPTSTDDVLIENDEEEDVRYDTIQIRETEPIDDGIIDAEYTPDTTKANITYLSKTSPQFTFKYPAGFIFNEGPGSDRSAQVSINSQAGYAKIEEEYGTSGYQKEYNLMQKTPGIPMLRIEALGAADHIYSVLQWSEQVDSWPNQIGYNFCAAIALEPTTTCASHHSYETVYVDGIQGMQYKTHRVENTVIFLEEPKIAIKFSQGVDAKDAGIEYAYDLALETFEVLDS